MLGQFSFAAGMSVQGARLHEEQAVAVAVTGYCHLPAGEAATPESRALEAYRRHGDRLCRGLAGSYAVALHDRARGAFVLAVDPLGLKPVFYRRAGGLLAFSTRLSHLAGESACETRYFADLLTRGEHTGTLTPFRGVLRLPPGASLVMARDGTRLVAGGALDVAPADETDEVALDERFRDLLAEAVQTACAGSGPVACELSGGLDSSSVLAVACRVLPTSPTAVSYVYSRSRTADESVWIDRALAGSGAPSLRLDVDVCPPLSGDRTTASDLPSTIMLRPKWRTALAGSMEAAGATILLTGEGGDAVLWGGMPDPLFVADALRLGRMRTFWTEAKRWAEAERGQRSRLYGLAEYGARPLWRYWQGRAVMPATVRPLPWLAGRPHGSGDPAWLGSGTSVGIAQALHFIGRSARLVGSFYEQLELGISVRHPLLYTPLVRFMLSLPWHQKRRPGVDRVLQRRALRGILPDAIRLRPGKGGSDQPWAEGLAGPDGWLAWLGERPCLAEMGLVDAQAWRIALKGMAVGDCASFFHLQAALSAEVWLRGVEARRGGIQRGGVVIDGVM